MAELDQKAAINQLSQDLKQQELRQANVGLIRRACNKDVAHGDQLGVEAVLAVSQRGSVV